MLKLLRNSKGQVPPVLMLITLGVTLVYFAGQGIKKGFHKVGCKIHHTEKCDKDKK